MTHVYPIHDCTCTYGAYACIGGGSGYDICRYDPACPEHGDVDPEYAEYAVLERFDALDRSGATILGVESPLAFGRETLPPGVRLVDGVPHYSAAWLDEVTA